MQPGQPSRTALRVALRRAAHQLYDPPPHIFPDPFAVAILGATYADELRKTATRLHKPFSTGIRAFLVARSRYAEDTLVAALLSSSPPTQYVLLGAGLDTFCLRNPYPGLRVFEVDHPGTQQWKRDLLAASSLEPRPGTVWVPTDFEHQALPGALAHAGFDPHAVTFFSWLGVVPYLTLAAFRETLAFISSLPSGTGLALDYSLPREELSHNEQLALDSLSSRVAQAGEPFRLFFTPSQIARELSGSPAIEDLGASELNARYFSSRSDLLALRGSAGRLLSARF